MEILLLLCLKNVLSELSSLLNSKILLSDLFKVWHEAYACELLLRMLKKIFSSRIKPNRKQNMTYLLQQLVKTKMICWAVINPAKDKATDRTIQHFSYQTRKASKGKETGDISMSNQFPLQLITFGILPFNLWSVKGRSLTTTTRHFPINPSSPITCPTDSCALKVISSQNAT